MAIDINVPSQVKNYANLAAFPATGSLKTIFIAEDTNKTYRWTGSAYVEISASQATAWGTITGTLSAQTDLNTALSGKVPTTRTLTINGTTQDLSADRTFTVSTGITIGTTAITSGTVGRVLFEGTGNVVQESANLFWDNTNGRLGIGTSSPTTKINIVTPNNGDALRLEVPSTNSTVYDFYLGNSDSTAYIRANSRILELRRQGASSIIRTVGGGLNDLALQAGGGITFTTYDTNERMRIIGSTGNVLIGTTTDAGYKLDVNGTARIKGTGTADANSFVVQNNAGVQTFRVNDYGQVQIGRTTAINWTFSSNTLSCTQYAFILSSSGSILSITGAGGVLGNDTGAKIADQGLIGSNQLPSAVLECNSTTRGFLPPRMTTTQKNAIATPATGLMVYDTTLNLICVYNGTSWITL